MRQRGGCCAGVVQASTLLLALLALLGLTFVAARGDAQPSPSPSITDIFGIPILNVDTNIWRGVPSLRRNSPGGRLGHTAIVQVREGGPAESRLIVFGGTSTERQQNGIGSDDTFVLNDDVWAFQLGSQTWVSFSRREGDAWPKPRTLHAAEFFDRKPAQGNAQLPFGNGQFMLVFAGSGSSVAQRDNLSVYADMWILDLETWTWHQAPLPASTEAGEWPLPRHSPVFTKCLDDDLIVYMHGGVVSKDPACGPLATECVAAEGETRVSSEVWQLDVSDPTQPVWTLLINDESTIPRLFNTFVCLNNVLYVSGGVDFLENLFNISAVALNEPNYIWALDIAAQPLAWAKRNVTVAAPLSDEFDIAAYQATSLRLDDHTFAVIGGQFNPFTFRRYITMFDDRTMTWTAFPRSRSQEDLSSRIYAHGSRFGDTAMIFGGLTLIQFAETIHHLIPQLEAVYEVSQHITPVGRLYSGNIFSLPDSALYLYGGFDGQLPRGDFWHFDVNRGLWREYIIGDFPGARISPLAAQLASGSLYIGLGTGVNHFLDDVYYFDLAREAFFPANITVVDDDDVDVTELVDLRRMIINGATPVPVDPARKFTDYPSEALVFSSTNIEGITSGLFARMTVYDELLIVSEKEVGHLHIKALGRQPDRLWPDPCLLCVFSAFRTTGGRVGALLFGGVVTPAEDAGKSISITQHAERQALNALVWVFWRDTVEWKIVTPQFITPRFSPGSTFSDGFLYITGGAVARPDFDVLAVQSQDFRPDVVWIDADVFETDPRLFDPAYTNSTEVEWFIKASTDPQGSRAHHILGARNETLFIWGGASSEGISPGRFSTMQLGCTIGHVSRTGSIRDCEPCAQGTYSGIPGSQRCIICPTHLTTREPGSTSFADCNQCVPGFCAAGECVVSQVFEASCVCGFGRAGDRCEENVALQSAIGSLTTILFIIILVYVWKRYKKRLRNLQEYRELQEQLLEETKGELHELEQAWSISPNEIEYIRRIDGDSPGAFGQVWLAKFSDVKVAVKQLKQSIELISEEEYNEFISEIKFMRRLRHRNIVYFYGAGFEDSKPFLVTEFMARGALDTVLRNKEIELSRARQLGFLLDTARGMEFLHTLTPPRIHRDLKSPNLLVNESWTVKVADFGTSRLVEQLHTAPLVGGKRRNTTGVPLSSNAITTESNSSSNSSGSKKSGSQGVVSSNASSPYTSDSQHSSGSLMKMTTNVGTLLWSAPEVLEGSDYTLTADVYSFAIVMWEVFTRQLPFEEYAQLWDVRSAVLAGSRPEIPEDISTSLQDLLRHCWAARGSERPSFTEIVDELESISAHEISAHGGLDAGVDDTGSHNSPIARTSVTSTSSAF